MFGEYAPADDAYAELAAKLAKADHQVPPEMRADLQRFYAKRAPNPKDGDDRELDAALARLAANR